MAVKCNVCGAPMENDTCSYCGHVEKKTFNRTTYANNIPSQAARPQIVQLFVMLMVMLLTTILINIQTTSYAATSIQGMDISFVEGDLEIPEVDVTNITAISIGTEVEFRIYYSGTNITHYNMFNPPSGTIVQKMKVFTQEDMNNGYMSIRIPLDTVEKCKELTLFVQHRKDYISTNSYFITENGKIDYQKLPVSVEFSDEFLSETIKGDLEITGSVLTSDLLRIEKLDLSNKGIKNLNGIEYLKNLKTLDITYNKITDISKINNLEKLEKLYVQDNPIQDYLLDSNIISKLFDYDFELDYQRALYANRLKEIGVFKGTSNGFELYREPTRIEALIMLIRLLGKEAEALQSDSTISVFNDVPSWAVSYANYAYNNGLTKGIGNNMFGSSDVIDAKSYVTFLLRSLGYNDSTGDFNWNDAIFYAQNIQLYDNSMQIELNNTVFLRAHVAELSYKALAAKIKGSNLTLIQKLVDDNVINKELAGKIQF